VPELDVCMKHRWPFGPLILSSEVRRLASSPEEVMRGSGSETVACARKENRERGVHMESSCVVGVHGALGD
jgi:hypothetical protein